MNVAENQQIASDPKEPHSTNKINDVYKVINHEDKFEQDNQSSDENADEEEATSEHLIMAFGSTYNRDVHEEIREVYEK